MQKVESFNSPVILLNNQCRFKKIMLLFSPISFVVSTSFYKPENYNNWGLFFLSHLNDDTTK